MEPVTPHAVTALWSDNSSLSEALVSVEFITVRTIVPPYIITVSVLGLALNAFVLCVFLANKDRMTVAEVYLGNLALADFALLCGVPFWAANILNGFNWLYGDALCKMVNSIMTVNLYTSVYTLVMISVDRYLAIVMTMKARWLRRTRYAKVTCVFLWIFGLSLSTPTMLHRKVMYFEEVQLTACMLDYSHGSSWKLANQVLLNVIGFVVPALVIVFSSGSIVKALRQRKESVGLQEVDDTKTTVLLYAVTLLFILCWGPFQVFTFLDTLYDIHMLDTKAWSHTLDVGGQVSAYLGILNSALNPVLYVLSGQYFRKKVNAILRRALGNRRGSDMTTYQRSVVSTYIHRHEQIKPVVI
ncbi:B1 bradykinin receptor [Corythoichthys intestinalis]|uniref:B1 bradykinin receptor n=1 Tax=Corythoichthys intestinalis TaxID=161448 RepID=UPI0025A6369A|nr:B1 bradykinin receptor [Corythoichthys intestinalis]XP_061798114.1 B2 bradykinin receptor-like [Nerophis lumbriciformis]